MNNIDKNYGYPFNIRSEDHSKIFFSDIVMDILNTKKIEFFIAAWLAGSSILQFPKSQNQREVSPQAQVTVSSSAYDRGFSRVFSAFIVHDRRTTDGSILQDRQIQAKFKHAKDFGVYGNPNRPNFELFKDKICEHMDNPSTEIKIGTYYKKTIQVRHYVNPTTGLNVMICIDTNEFLSGWQLNENQLNNVLERGSL